MLRIKTKPLLILAGTFLTLTVATTFLTRNVIKSDKIFEEETHNEENETSWALFLINKENPLSGHYIFEKEVVEGTFEMDKRCAENARQMLSDAKNDGINLKVYSAYRSAEKQTKTFDNYVERLISEGHSESTAVNITSSQIANPYESEHNAGLAIDILSGDWYDTHDDLTADFENTAEFIWLYENCYKYGFILRYPPDKTMITGIDYEPWHYRYVGEKDAEYIMKNNLCLEEYMDYLVP